MPRTEIALRAGRPPEVLEAIARAVYDAMREAIDVPEDDYFVTINEHGPAGFHYGRTYLGVTRSDGLIMLQITLSSGRRPAQKKALFESLAARVSAAAGVSPSDVFVSLVENAWENWSLGDGRAHYAE